MERIHINDIKKHTGKKVTIAGFVQVIRDQGNITFLLIRDVSGVVQVVVTKDEKEAIKTAKELSLESVVEINGLVKEEKQAPGGIEIAAQEINVLSLAEPELPIPVVEKGGEETDQSIRLDWRFLDLRKTRNTLIFKVWTAMEQAFREYWLENGYIEIHSPKILGTATESAPE